MDPRLRAAVDASACWYTDVCATHGIPSSVREGLWSCAGPPPGLHSAALAVEPSVTVARVLAAVEGLGHCSVADPFASLDLRGSGMGLLFAAQWVHRPPLTAAPPEMPAGWRAIDDAAALDDWNGRFGTTGVLLPALLGLATFRVLARTEGAAVVGGAVAHLGTGVVGVSNVLAADGAQTDWPEVVRAVHACFPGRSMVGYESDGDLEAALAAGFTAVGEHRVWAR